MFVFLIDGLVTSGEDGCFSFDGRELANFLPNELRGSDELPGADKFVA